MSRLHALVNVKNWMFLLACSVWVMRCTALLCRAILRPFTFGFSHVDRRWGHVSIVVIAQCAVGVLMCEGPEDIFLVITHV